MRIAELDLIRGIGILAVIMVHIAQHAIFYSYGNATVNVILDAITRFCVPFFIFASGVAFSYNYHDKKDYYLNFLYKRLRYIGIPYLLWSLFGLVRYHIYEPKKIIIGLLTGNAMIHLYFIVLIFQFYILAPLILRFCKIKWHIALAISFAINMVLLILYSHTSLFVGNQIPYFSNAFINPLFWLFYFTLGIVIGIQMEEFLTLTHKLKWIYVFILWIIMAVISVYNEYYIFAHNGIVQHFFRPTNMLYSLSAIMLIWTVFGKMNSRVNMILTTLGRYSFGIYLVHIPILFAIHALTKNYWGNPLEQVFSFLACTVLSFAFTFIVSKPKFGAFLVGKIG